MADIKTKVRGHVKTINKTINTSNNIKSNIISTKDKLENTYTPNEYENEVEYASSKINNAIQVSGRKGISKFDDIGKKTVKETKQNIDNSIQRVKAFKNKVAKQKENEVIKNNFEKLSKNTIKESNKIIKSTSNKAQRYVKTAKQTTTKAIKTSQNVAKTTKATAKATAKATQKMAQATKAAIKASVETTKATVKAVVATIKAILATLKGLIALIVAGGWISIIVIIVICMIAFLVTSIYGIFFSNDYNTNSKTMSQVVSELNTEFMNKITTIQQENPYDEYDITGSRADWKDVLAIYVAKYSNGEYQTEMASLDDNKIAELTKIFWDMNNVSFTKDVSTEEQTIIHLTWTEHKTVTYTKLHITITSKTAEQMAEEYHFSNKQKDEMNELLSDEFIAVWSSVIYGSTGNSDIVEVAKSQLGNVGGQPYWSWYGFSSRVEWCATFVSWCANQCGYIESGIIPKFAGCEGEGVAWFKACGLWQNGGYTPKAGDIIFFDWADKHDGHADHVGIVEKVENGRVYTIEGNSNDSCKERNYDLNSSEIEGYGTPAYN